MNRISVRGVGFGVAAVATASLVVGAPAPTAHSATDGRVGSTLSAAVLVTAYQPRLDGSFAELARLHAARQQVAHAGDIALAHAAHLRAAASHALALRAKQRAAAVVRASRFSTRPVVPGTTRALGQSMARARGWSGVKFSCLDAIWTHESNWRVSASNSGSGAYGIPQAQPGSKMASAGADWQTSAATQIAWGLAYIARTYGSPCAAWTFWQDHSWY